MIVTIPRGWRLASTKSSRICRKPTSTYRGRGLLRGRRVIPVTVSKGSPRHAVLALTPFLRPHRAGPFLSRNLLQRLGLATGSRLWRRGH